MPDGVEIHECPTCHRQNVCEFTCTGRPGFGQGHKATRSVIRYRMVKRDAGPAPRPTQPRPFRTPGHRRQR